jgi:hypothetical protein
MAAMRVEGQGTTCMTTMVAVTIAAHIGRPSELGAGDGMMFRRCLIRADYMRAAMTGNIPVRALRLIQEWSAPHRDELRPNWARARESAPLVRIDPLP